MKLVKRKLIYETYYVVDSEDSKKAEEYILNNINAVEISDYEIIYEEVTSEEIESLEETFKRFNFDSIRQFYINKI